MTGIVLYKMPDDPKILKELAEKGIFICQPGDIVKVISEEEVTTA